MCVLWPFTRANRWTSRFEESNIPSNCYHDMDLFNRIVYSVPVFHTTPESLTTMKDSSHNQLAMILTEGLCYYVLYSVEIVNPTKNYMWNSSVLFAVYSFKECEDYTNIHLMGNSRHLTYIKDNTKHFFLYYCFMANECNIRMRYFICSIKDVFIRNHAWFKTN